MTMSDPGLTLGEKPVALASGTGSIMARQIAANINKTEMFLTQTLVSIFYLFH